MSERNIYVFNRLLRKTESTPVDMISNFLSDFRMWGNVNELELTPWDPFGKLDHDSLSDLRKTAATIVKDVANFKDRDERYYWYLWEDGQRDFYALQELSQDKGQILKGFLYANFRRDPAKVMDNKKAAEALLEDWLHSGIIDSWKIHSDTLDRVEKANKFVGIKYLGWF